MMNIDRNTEILRLAKVMHREPAELDFLKPLDGTALQSLRRQLIDALLAEFGTVFEKLAAGGKLLPAALNAKLCEKIFGPTMTAYMSYYTPPKQAEQMTPKFSIDFLAAVSRDIIPEKAEEMIQSMPVELMRETTRALNASKDYYVMGGFVDFMPEDKVLVLMNEIDTPEANLRISAYTQRKDRIAGLVEKFDDKTLRELIDTASQHTDLQDEVLRVATHMNPATQQRSARLTMELGETHVAQARARAEQLGIEAELAPMLEVIDA